jgi:hypothetical protein
LNADGKIEVARVLENINIDEAFWCHFRKDILHAGLSVEPCIVTARVGSFQKNRPFVAVFVRRRNGTTSSVTKAESAEAKSLFQDNEGG